jgi:hypothetical protein
MLWHERLELGLDFQPCSVRNDPHIMRTLTVSITVTCFLLAFSQVMAEAQGRVDSQNPSTDIQGARQAVLTQVPPLFRQVSGMLQSLGTIVLEKSKGDSNTYTYQTGRVDPPAYFEAACQFGFSITQETVRTQKGQPENDNEVQHRIGFNFNFPVMIYVGDVASRGPEVWASSSHDRSRDRPGQLYNPGDSGCNPSLAISCGVKDISYKDGSKTDAQDFVVLEHLPNKKFAASLQNLLQQAADLCSAARGR